MAPRVTGFSDKGQKDGKQVLLVAYKCCSDYEPAETCTLGCMSLTPLSWRGGWDQTLFVRAESPLRWQQHWGVSRLKDGSGESTGITCLPEVSSLRETVILKVSGQMPRKILVWHEILAELVGELLYKRGCSPLVFFFRLQVVNPCLSLLVLLESWRVGLLCITDQHFENREIISQSWLYRPRHWVGLWAFGQETILPQP